MQTMTPSTTETTTDTAELAALEAAFRLPAVEPVRVIADAPRAALDLGDYVFMALLASLAVGAVMLLALTTFA